MAGPSCGACGSSRTHTFVAVKGVPAHVGVLWPTHDAAAACPRGDIELAFCRDCGFIWNTAFDEGLVNYTQEYNNSLAGSPLFRAFDTELAKSLVTRYDIHDTTVIEIGSGDARFLTLLCEFGANRGFGYDPSATTLTVAEGTDHTVHIVPGYFGPGHGHDECGLVVCRQVLEHIVDPHELVRVVRDEFDHDTVVYFEVPNTLLLLENLSIWDLCYEHCSYFVTESLQRLFELDGYEVLEAAPSFAGQFVSIEARPRGGTGGGAGTDLTHVAELVDRFGEHLTSRRDTWLQRLYDWRAAGEKVAVWGAGARAVGFFALLGITDEVDCIVDVNDHKQGTYLAGPGLLIEPPERLRAVAPDHVVIVNPIYEDEIRESLHELDVHAEVVVA